MIKYKTSLLFFTLLLAELVSFNAFAMPALMPWAFFAIVITTLILTIKKLEWGIMIVFTELIIGSLGYLFWLDIGGFRLSIRIALFMVVMSVWFMKLIYKLLKTNTYNLKPKTLLLKAKIYLKENPLFTYVILLGFAIFWGLINGFLNNNNIKNIFFDFNGWLYILLLLPMMKLRITNDQPPPEQASPAQPPLDRGGVLLVAVTWLSLKTFFLLYIFSHNMYNIMPAIYTWVRDTRVGEITDMGEGFYRIFFQSHIFVLISIFIVLFIIIFKYKDKIFNFQFSIFKQFPIFQFLILSIFLSVVILSFSRSNWAGLIFGLLLSAIFIIYLAGWKKLIFTFSFLALSFIFSLVLIFAIVKFPFPDPTAAFGAGMISGRATKISGEAALSSRWNLFPHMKEKIMKKPILGHGFGTTVTYISSDPRILENNPDGYFTTFTFEWGWLDIWIKLGILGIIAYIALILKIFFSLFPVVKYDKNYYLKIGLTTGLLSMAAVSFFSPYMNHPLGIGYVLLVIFQITSNK